MNFTFEALESEYRQHLASMKLLKMGLAEQVAKRLLQNRHRFLAVQRECGVPALWLMPVFEREGPSFDAYFGNGDPLNKPTEHVPRGRGPFQTWEEGVIDALHLDHITETVAWSWEMACYEWERWNGMGPRNHGRPSGYLWSGTDIYQGGKYVADGIWSPRTFDHELGTIILAKAIAAADPELASGFIS